MAAFRKFELEAIRLMSAGVLSDKQMQALCDATHADNYEYTGCGYFLTVSHPSLPEKPCTLSQPAVVGKAGNVQAGFVVFLGNGKLALECHTWGPVDVPADFRDREVTISTPPIHRVESGREAT
jgi:hypothetical protein